jgi:hypothetical protein
MSDAIQRRRTRLKDDFDGIKAGVACSVTKQYTGVCVEQAAGTLADNDFRQLSLNVLFGETLAIGKDSCAPR